MTLAASRETTSTTVEIVVNTNNGDTIPVPLLSKLKTFRQSHAWTARESLDPRCLNVQR